MSEPEETRELPEGGAELDEVEVKDLLRVALRPAPNERPATLLNGVQRKLRARSRGKFYADGWSTATSPKSTYWVTSLLMLLVVLVVYVLLVPGAGSPVP